MGISPAHPQDLDATGRVGQDSDDETAALAKGTDWSRSLPRQVMTQVSHARLATVLIEPGLLASSIPAYPVPGATLSLSVVPARQLAASGTPSSFDFSPFSCVPC
jgi:hypothetical protein